MESTNQSQSEISSATIGTERKTDKPKSFKSMLIGMIICAVLAVGGIGIGIYGIFIKKPSAEEALEMIKNDSVIETISTVAKTEDIDTSKPLEEQEVTITNQYVLDDLNRKISILTGAYNLDADDSPLLNSAMAYNMVESFYSGNLDTTTKKATAVLQGSRSLFSLYETFNIDYSNDVIARWIKENYSSTLDYIKQMSPTTISYQLANKIYSGLFNESLPKENISTGICGFHYAYIPEAEVFINDFGFDGVGGCGGTGFSGIFVRKDSYKAKGNEAYVYAKIASTHLYGGDFGWVVYDDFYTREDSYNREIINTSINIYNGVLRETLADNSFMDAAADYRFVFKKSNSGTYYFDKLEKL